MKTRETKEIRDLLDRYLEGKTSLEEEDWLCSYFEQEEVPDEFEPFRAEFMYYARSRMEEPGPAIDHEIDELSISLAKPARQLSWYRVAAAVLLLISAFYFGYSLRPDNELKEELNSLKYEVRNLRETTVRVMLDGGSAHRRIRALVMASDMPAVTDDLLEEVLKTFNQDNSDLVRAVALEFLGFHRQNDLVKNALVRSIASQDFSLQLELLSLIRELNDDKLIEQLKELLKTEKLAPELVTEIEQIIQFNRGASI